MNHSKKSTDTKVTRVNELERNTIMHVGERIKEVLDEQGRSASWLASKIPCERTNMYDIFKREDVSVALLFKVSYILGHDFFLEISDELRSSQIEASPYSIPAFTYKSRK